METCENKTGKSPDDIFEKDMRSRCRVSGESMKAAACEAAQQMEDTMLSLVPPQVTRHLAEAHKEFVRAGQRLGDVFIGRLEKRAQRAEDVHARMKAEKERRASEKAASESPANAI